MGQPDSVPQPRPAVRVPQDDIAEPTGRRHPDRPVESVCRLSRTQLIAWGLHLPCAQFIRAELDADPRADGRASLGHRVLPGALAGAAHHQQVPVTELLPEEPDARARAIAWIFAESKSMVQALE